MYKKIKEKYEYKSFEEDKYICVNGDSLNVLKELKENSVDSIVLDPFMGSGSTGKATVKEGLRFIGIDLEKEYYEIALKRIEYELKQGKFNF